MTDLNETVLRYSAKRCIEQKWCDRLHTNWHPLHIDKRTLLVP
ncbi:hypothetical protein [Roseofilum sp. SID1]|nr:hypothetical protein [Roseofilum sp. SID1]